MPHASDFDAKLYQISENTQQICNKFAPKTSNIRKSKNKKEIIITHSISVILLHFCFFLLDLLSFVFAYTLLGTVVSHGLQDEFERIFDAVHESNMSKLDENSKPIYRKDGKILKSSRYHEPDLSFLKNKK